MNLEFQTPPSRRIEKAPTEAEVSKELEDIYQRMGNDWKERTEAVIDRLDPTCPSPGLLPPAARSLQERGAANVKETLSSLYLEEMRESGLISERNPLRGEVIESLITSRLNLDESEAALNKHTTNMAGFDGRRLYDTEAISLMNEKGSTLPNLNPEQLKRYAEYKEAAEKFAEAINAYQKEIDRLELTEGENLKKRLFSPEVMR